MKLCKNSVKTVVAMLLVCVMVLGMAPSMGVYAAQVNDYTDPVDNWLTANGRTNELDMNATTTYETNYCAVCDRDTLGLTYRVPEYTKSGQTALNRGVKYSDGTLIDGVGSGNLDDGTPGVDAFFTAYHWTKSVCQTCGTFNSLEGEGVYNYNRNVYALYSCDHSFFFDFDNTEYRPLNDKYHTTVLKKGKYCQFCRGTQARASEKQEAHSFDEIIDEQAGNNRFFISKECSDCNYKTNQYVTAKSVVSSYYGEEDGEAHTVTVSDLSDAGVHTSIRYGTSANKCTLASAPNYTEAGYYPVYYEINYQYDNKYIVENGVSYVWLLKEQKEDDTIIVVPPSTAEKPHEHEFHYLETIAPSCTELGYERFQCAGCGELDKRNYMPAKGHEYDEVVIREATCKQGGLVLTLCSKCGDFYQTTTALGAHKYKLEKHNPTCQSVGFTEHICEICGDNYITDMTSLIAHSYERVTKKPTCMDRGYTTSTCTMCGHNYVSDYTEPTGHKWDNGTTVTNSTCNGEGVIEYKCENCSEKMIQAISPTGHNAGPEATCTQAQLCLECGTVLENAKGHNYSAKVIAPTCTSMGYTIYTCDVCQDNYNSDYTDKTAHEYSSVVTAPTCTEHGYTTYSCKNCDDEYVNDYVDIIPHAYRTEVTAPTCTSMGHTTYTCNECGSSYVNDYTEMLEHNYNKEVIEPTCKEHGYAVYTCPDCGKSYIGDYTENKEHNYIETVIPPTCTEMGYSIFECRDCDDSYKGNYVDKIPHDYEITVTEATCTQQGYTTYVCKNCSDSYISGYVESTGHTLSDWIIDLPATIESAGEKHIECKVCGEVLMRMAILQLVAKDRTDEDGKAAVGGYDILLTNENGLPIFDSEIVIDVLDNITILLPENRLLDFNDRTRIQVKNTEDGTPAVGLNIYISDSKKNNATGATNKDGILLVPNDASSTGDTNGTIGTEDEGVNRTYVVSVTDKENIIIHNCDIRIGESNDIVVDLPDGLVLTTDSPAIITVLDQNGVPQQGVDIIVMGDKDYVEKGSTDVYGKLTVPNVYEGYTDKEGRVHVNGHNIFVADEQGAVENAFVKMNEDSSVSVNLPEGKIIDHHNRTTVSVYDRMGTAIQSISITVNDTTGASKSDITNEMGQIVVPPLNEDYTDTEGNAKVNSFDVKVMDDETNPVADALVYHDADNSEIVIALPVDRIISYANRITVTVTSDGNPIAGMNVVVTDFTEASERGITDENGVMVVPARNKDMTDADGKAIVSGVNVHIADAEKNIENAFVVMNEDGTIHISLPEGTVLTADKRITVTVTDSENKPMKNVPVTVLDVEGKTEKDLTNENGQAFVPPVASDFTDVNGYAEVNGYAVTVADETKAIEKALVTLGEDGKISVKLPLNILFDYGNRISVEVINRADNSPVKDMTVTASETILETLPTPPPSESENETEKDESEPEETEPEPSKPEEPETVEKTGKTLTGITGEDGKVVFPPANEDVTDGEGNSGITEEIPGKGEDTDGDGIEDKPGETEIVSYKVAVSNTQGAIPGALVKIADKKVVVTLPDGYTLTASNQTTVIVTDNDGKAISGVSVTVTDNKNGTATKTTDTNGKIVVPVKSTGGGGGGSSFGGGGGGGSYVSNTTNITVTDKDGKSVSVSKSTDSKGNITLTLPNGKELTDGNYYTIKATDSKGNAKSDVNITLKDKNNNSASGITDKNGVLVLPAKEHKAYIVGYDDGTFRPDSDMSRAEAAAIFARLIAEEKAEKINGKADFKDVAQKAWYADYIGYLAEYDIIKGYTDGTFKPEAPVTRAEFVAMAVRYYDLFNDVAKTGYTVKYTDVSSAYWAYADIAFAKQIGWLNGYSDGSFRGDNNITRAEVVTVTNRATDRAADKDYVKDNFTRLNRFTDVTDSSLWYFMDVIESSNDHMAVEQADAEVWLK